MDFKTFKILILNSERIAEVISKTVEDSNDLTKLLLDQMSTDGLTNWLNSSIKEGENPVDLYIQWQVLSFKRVTHTQTKLDLDELFWIIIERELQ